MKGGFSNRELTEREKLVLEVKQAKVWADEATDKAAKAKQRLKKFDDDNTPYEVAS
jgi:hypothetical protein